MRFFKYLALIALATVPLMLIERKRREATPASDDDIFERDLRVD